MIQPAPLKRWYTMMVVSVIARVTYKKNNHWLLSGITTKYFMKYCTLVDQWLKSFI